MAKGDRRITLYLDDLDYATVWMAVSRRAAWGSLPDGDGDVMGRLIAEICRGWMERLERESNEGEVSGG